MKNPLADPHIIGISSGAGLAGIFVIVMFPALEYLIVPTAFCGAMLAAACIYILAWKNGIRPLRIVLAGVAVSSFLGAGISAILVLYSDRVHGALMWMVGGLHGFQLAHAGNVNNIGVGGNECFQTVRRRRRIVFQGHAACGDIGKAQQLRRTARNAAFKLHRYVLRRAVQYGNALAFLRHFCLHGGNAFIHIFVKFFCFCFIAGYLAHALRFSVQSADP